jgi:hypothetical protein
MFKKLLSITTLCVGISLALCASEPNNGQSSPKLSSAKSHDSHTIVKGKLQSVKETRFIIQFFNNEKDRPEGQIFLGQVKVKTDSHGKASFKAQLPATERDTFVTATATRLNIHQPTDSSEFSKSVKVKR